MSQHKITHSELQTIISTAKGNYAQMKLPMKISKKLLQGYDPAQVLLIESVIMYLNGKGLLNTDVTMDYDDRK